MDALRIPPGDAAFLAVYNAKAGAASFDTAALTCANVSCHGAVVAPNWQTGTISVNTDAGCRACHKLGTAAGTPESNSPFSGLHSSHLDPTGIVKATCVECHNMANATTGATNHFRFLNTPQMEGPASQTVEPNGSAANYNAANQTCTVNCHTVQHTNFSWQGGANHAVPFLATGHTTVAQTGFDANCAPCHAVTGSSPVASAPSCAVCHQSAAALPFTNCASCHVKPPAGTTYPNIAGKHAKHDALANVTGVCGPCHTGLDSGSQAHYDRANAGREERAARPPGDAAFQSTFNAKAGAASFSNTALTCASVSCHGAVAAPSWQTGTISTNTDAGCRLCHKLGSALGTPENNSPFSGLHDFHLSVSGTVVALCTDCHDMALATTGATNHFKFLNTPQMEGPASDTVAPLGLRTNYNATNQTCTVTCHSHQHTTSSWVGGASHAVPFLATAHTVVNQARLQRQLRDLPRGYGDFTVLPGADLRDLPHGGVAAHGPQLHFVPRQPADGGDVSGDRREALQAQRPDGRHRRLRRLPQRAEHRQPGALRPGQCAPGEERAPRRPRGRGLRFHLQREDGGSFLQQYRPYLRQRELPRRAVCAELADRDDQREHGRRVPAVPRVRHDAIQRPDVDQPQPLPA